MPASTAQGKPLMYAVRNGSNEHLVTISRRDAPYQTKPAGQAWCRRGRRVPASRSGGVGVHPPLGLRAGCDGAWRGPAGQLKLKVEQVLHSLKRSRSSCEATRQFQNNPPFPVSLGHLITEALVSPDPPCPALPTPSSLMAWDSTSYLLGHSFSDPRRHP